MIQLQQRGPNIFNISNASKTTDVLTSSLTFSGCWQQRCYDSVQRGDVNCCSLHPSRLELACGLERELIRLFSGTSHSTPFCQWTDTPSSPSLLQTSSRTVRCTAFLDQATQSTLCQSRTFQQSPSSLHHAAQIQVADMNFLDIHFRVLVRSTAHCTERTTAKRFCDSKRTNLFNTKFTRKVHSQKEKDESIGRSNFFRSTHRAVYGLSVGTHKMVDWSAVSGSDPSR